MISRPTLGQRWRSVLVLGFGYLPDSRKAPPFTQPQGIPQERILAEIAASIAAMEALITRCEAKSAAGAKLLDHPILGPLTGGQWRKFHLVHGLHHIKQIRRLREGKQGLPCP